MVYSILKCIMEESVQRRIPAADFKRIRWDRITEDQYGTEKTRT